MILNDWSVLALAGLTSLLVTLVATPLVRAVAIRVGWIAKPLDERWGRRVITRFGGVAMFLGFASGVLCWIPLKGPVLGLCVGAGLVFLLGLLDDVHHLLPYTKLIGQLAIGCVMVITGLQIGALPWPWLSIPVSIFWFVLVMNAFNLLDNMDGLASGVGAIAAGFYALHALAVHQMTFAALGMILCGACLGFLRYNFPPAKIYMGDSGSHFLGLTLASLAILDRWDHSTQLLSVLAVPTLLLAVPIFDTCFVTVQRLMHRQHPFLGGRDHVSHRLAILGLSTRQTVMVLYGVSACLGLLSVVSSGLKPLSALVVWVAVFTALLLFGRYLAYVQVYRLAAQPSASRVSQPVGAPRSTTLIETMLLHKRRLVEIVVDFSIISCAYVVAYLLRFEGALTGEFQSLIIQSLPLILLIKLACFGAFGLYRGIWRYLGLADLLTTLKAVTLGSLLSSAVLLFLWRFEGYSRAVLVIDWMLTFLGIGAARVTERLLDEWLSRVVNPGKPVLIIGAGDTGERVLRSLKYDGRGPWRAIGFLDDDLRKRGNRIHGATVIGNRTCLPRLVDEHAVQEVLIAINDPPGELLEYVRGQCEPLGVAWRVVTAGIRSAA